MRLQLVALIVIVIIYTINGQSLQMVQNDFVKIVVTNKSNDQGRFSIETTGGDPGRDNDNDLPLIYGRPIPWTSYTTLAINNNQFAFGGPTLKRAGKQLPVGLVTQTQVLDNEIVVNGRIDGVDITQRLALYRSPFSNVKDAVLIEYTLQNQHAITKNVGLRIMMDTMLGKNDAAPFRIGSDAIESERVIKGDDIVDFWQTFDSLVSPNVIGQGLLRHPPSGLTPPDQLILMNWGSLADNGYQVQSVPGRSFIRAGENEPDTALALLWNQQPLGPKQSRRYRTVMGLGDMSVSPGDISIGISAPTQLAITDPNDYLMIAYLSNTGGYTVKNAVAKLTLPTGLMLVNGTSNVSLGNMLPGGSRQLAYTLRVNPKQAKEGTQTIALDIQSDTLANQTINRSIEFTGQPKLGVYINKESVIQRGMDAFVYPSITVVNESDVAISNVQAVALPKAPIQLPVYETATRSIQSLLPGQGQTLDWIMAIDDWQNDAINGSINVTSGYTQPLSVALPITVTMGKPSAKLYYSEPVFYVGDYGYVWITLLDMPTFSNVSMALTWDSDYVSSVRVSPQPWLIESVDDVMSLFHHSKNQLDIVNVSATNPPWRMIVGKWHFKASKPGFATITLWQNNQPLDTVAIEIKGDDPILKEEKNESY